MSEIELPQALNSLQSQKFGRRVYQIQQGDQSYWLKLQLKQSNQAYQDSFLHELDIYQQLNRFEKVDQSFLCNFSIFNPYQKFNLKEEVFNQALWVENVSALFATHPNQLELSDIFSTLMLSLEVLEQLHDLGYVHGDLKLQHFRIKQQQAVLIDYEQCFHIRDVEVMPNTATPRYMAPELFHAAPKSFATDLYALGIIWLEWLTQRRLTAKSYQDWAILHCQQLEVDLPSRFNIFEAVLKSMLKKKAGQRCTNIYQIKQQLSQIA